MKNLLKTLLVTISRIIVFPFVVFYQLEKLVLPERRIFSGYSQFFACLPGITGEYIRREFYRMTLKGCAANCCISYGTIFSTSKAEIGENVYIGPYCTIGWAKIGKDTLIASHSSVISGVKQHGICHLDKPIREQPGDYQQVAIGEDCWIGTSCVVGANIGNQSVIAAGSIVLNEIGEKKIAGGNPASDIRDRD